MQAVFGLLGGGALLYFGAEWFVGGASALAVALRVPQLLVGLTVVAYGTSAPELIVGVEAASSGHGAIAVGNVIGSNIANLGLILALAVLVRPAHVSGELRRRDLPVFVGSTLALPLVVYDDRVSRVEGMVLLALALTYTTTMIVHARRTPQVASMAATARASRVADVAGAPTPKGRLRAVLTAGAGLGMLLVGGKLFIASAVSLAHDIGLSERVVGLTVVALGTSLPELVTSLIAARRGHSDLAIGNVVGSNIFNGLLCLGAAALAQPLHAPVVPLALDLVFLVVMTAAAALFLRSERTVNRIEATALLFLYVLFLGATLVRGRFGIT